MKENVLKKQFKEKDVKRLRNLIQGKYGDKVRKGVGYNKIEHLRKEGDTWEEDGRKWTIKNGIKQNITKLDKLKKIVITPLFCPKCKTQMKKRFDGDYYKIHKKCFNCVIKMETKLRRWGKWEAYEKAIINADVDAFLKDYEIWANEAIDNSTLYTNYFTEQGDKENWKGGKTKKQLKELVKKDIEQIKKLKKK
tara:strand:+ start:599 stop:1180 length:582 start_codon:yes stop_codon:yes gene_type:complete